MKIRIPILTCLRCGHNWTPRGDKGLEDSTRAVKYIETEVTICPGCKSPYWDKPRKEK
jgi:hypothetical protein